MTQIQLLEFYSCSGMAGHLQPGIYSINDPALHGRAEFLLEHRKAVLLVEEIEEPSAPVSVIPASVELIDISTMSLAKIKARVSLSNPSFSLVASLHTQEKEGRNRKSVVEFLAEEWRKRQERATE